MQLRMSDAAGFIRHHEAAPETERTFQPIQRRRRILVAQAGAQRAGGGAIHADVSLPIWTDVRRGAGVVERQKDAVPFDRVEDPGGNNLRWSGETSQGITVAMTGRTVELKPHFVSTPDYAETGGRWLEAFPPHPIAPDRAIRYGRTPDFLAKLDAVVPALGAIESSSLFVAGENGTICTSGGTILPDHSWYSGHQDQMPVARDVHQVRHLPGRAVSLASDWAYGSYGHFIQDVLPRIGILEKLGLDLGGFDHVICALPSKFCRYLVESFGVEGGRIVRPERGVALKPDTLVAPTFPGSRRGMEPWAIDVFRRHLMPDVSRQDRRIYVLRRSRKPKNEAALLEILKPHGFELYAPELDQNGQSKVFAESSIVVGAAGSALANLVFCQPNTNILEILGSDHVFPYYYAISMAAGLRYHCMVGESSVTRRDSSIGPSPHDFDVDENVFAQAIDDLIRNTSAM
jgi:hypothetical protein